MIVKNEAHVIERCLQSVKSIIDYWVIVDTGSTDGTQKIIKKYLKNIPGKLVERPWKDFAYNRTEALELARPNGDYILIIDADDTFKISSNFKIPDLDKDAYLIKFFYGPVVYQRIQLVSTRIKWRYEGVLHEFITCDEEKTEGFLDGVSFHPTHDGARSKDSETYRKDAKILEDALELETNTFLIARYTFYLAQSYKDHFNPQKAIEY